MLDWSGPAPQRQQVDSDELTNAIRPDSELFKGKELCHPCMLAFRTVVHCPVRQIVALRSLNLKQSRLMSSSGEYTYKYVPHIFADMPCTVIPGLSEYTDHSFQVIYIHRPALTPCVLWTDIPGRG